MHSRAVDTGGVFGFSLLSALSSSSRGTLRTRRLALTIHGAGYGGNGTIDKGVKVGDLTFKDVHGNMADIR